MRLFFENALLSGARRFAARSVDIYEKPVMFPPGRAKLDSTPSRTGSPLNAMTIGTVVVARFTAHTAGPKAMITSTLRATSSAARSGSRSGTPSAKGKRRGFSLLRIRVGGAHHGTDLRGYLAPL